MTSEDRKTQGRRVAAAGADSQPKGEFKIAPPPGFYENGVLPTKAWPADATQPETPEGMGPGRNGLSAVSSAQAKVHGHRPLPVPGRAGHFASAIWKFFFRYLLEQMPSHS